jgi:PAS domain S-box-containing protein
MADAFPIEPTPGRFVRANYLLLLVGTALMVGLYFISRENYLLFHTLVEMFSVVISITIFALIWNSRSLVDNGYLTLLGAAFLFIGALDLVHALAYKGMAVFPSTAQGQPNAANLATQLWLAGRYLQSLTLAIAPLFLRPRFKKIRAEVLVAGYAVVTALLFLSIAWKIFPASNLDSVGLTPFKIASEYVIMLVFAIGLAQLILSNRVRKSLDPDVLRLLAFSIAFNIAAEIAFTEYMAVNDLINLAGHLIKIIAVYLTYKAIIETGLLRPYTLLFRELTQRESALRASEHALQNSTEALQESLMRERARAVQMEAIMDVVPAIVWIAHDPGSRNVTGNRASSELLNLPPNANHSRYLPDVAERFKFYDQNGNLLTQETLPMHVAASTGQAISDYQETVVSRDGTEHHLYGNITPQIDENGAPAGAVGAFIDITERVHAEQALHESERRYRILFETMAEGFSLHELIYDENGQAVDSRIHETNPAYERMMGLPRTQLIGYLVSELMGGQRSPWMDDFARVVESGKPERVERYSQLAGKYLEAMINPVQDHFFTVLAVDVTERRNNQEALRQSEARLRRLVDSNIIGIIYSDPQGKITQANDAFLEIIGYSRAEFDTGLINWLDLTPPEYHPVEEQAMAEASERGACAPYEKEYIRKDGVRVPVLIGYAYFADSESPFICFILDLTEQKQAEAAVREYAARLEQSNRELQDFAFVASHDLQEPLRKIQAFGERLNGRSAGNLDNDARDYLERMLNAASRMRAMINDLLALSRVTTQGRPFEQVNLNDVAHEVLSDLETRIERTGGKVEVGDLPTLEADPLQMHQLLQNLIGNALKFHKPDQQPQLRLYAECVKDGRQVIMYIEDQGIGFEEQYLERIFQPFQRLHGMSQYEGSGMGLAICRKIVERHSGTITAHSTPGAGATFVITMPIRQPLHRD